MRALFEGVIKVINSKETAAIIEIDDGLFEVWSLTRCVHEIESAASMEFKRVATFDKLTKAIEFYVEKFT